jgi:hypothetical protein
MLKKKHNTFADHRVYEAVAAGAIRIMKDDGKTNIAGLMTKPLSGPWLKEFCFQVLY